MGCRLMILPGCGPELWRPSLYSQVLRYLMRWLVNDHTDMCLGLSWSSYLLAWLWFITMATLARGLFPRPEQASRRWTWSRGGGKGEKQNCDGGVACGVTKIIIWVP